MHFTVMRSNGVTLPDMDIVLNLPGTHNVLNALAAIAKPQLFFAGLRDQGLELGVALAWPDHDPLLGFNPALAEGDWFCTEKDAVKLWARFPQVWAVPLALHGLDHWWPQIDQALALRISSRHGNQIA
jgi:tetraacyldisaccharide 4'-kinase